MECSPTHGLTIVAGARATTHIPLMKNLETKLELPNIKNQEYIQTNQHTRHTICTFYTSP